MRKPAHVIFPSLSKVYSGCHIDLTFSLFFFKHLTWKHFIIGCHNIISLYHNDFPGVQILSAILNIYFPWSLYYIYPNSRLCCSSSFTLMILYIMNTSRVEWLRCCLTEFACCLYKCLLSDMKLKSLCAAQADRQLILINGHHVDTKLKQWTPHSLQLFLPAKQCCCLHVLLTFLCLNLTKL